MKYFDLPPIPGVHPLGAISILHAGVKCFARTKIDRPYSRTSTDMEDLMQGLTFWYRCSEKLVAKGQTKQVVLEIKTISLFLVIWYEIFFKSNISTQLQQDWTPVLYFRLYTHAMLRQLAAYIVGGNL